jgi:hypothetical protein
MVIGLDHLATIVTITLFQMRLMPDASSSVQHLQDNIQELLGQIHAKDEELLQLRNENEELRRDLGQSKATTLGNESSLLELRNRNDELQEALKLSEAKIVANVNEFIQLQSDNDELGEKLRQSAAKLLEKDRQKIRLHSENSELHGLISRLLESGQLSVHGLFELLNRSSSANISVSSVAIGTNVLFVWSVEHNAYAVHHSNPRLDPQHYFLHRDSAEAVGVAVNLKSRSCIKSKSYFAAEVTDKEKCVTNKPGNKLGLELGTKFCRVKCRPIEESIVGGPAASSR